MMLDELATRFADEGLVPSGYTVKTGTMPPTPDRILALYETGGAPCEDFFAGTPIDLPGLHVEMRGAARDYDTPRLDLETLYQAAASWGAFVVSGVRYLRLQPLQQPFPLTRDLNERVVHAVNFLVWKQSSLDPPVTVTPPVVPVTPPTIYQLVESLGGDSNGFMQPVAASNYPSGATQDALVPGSWTVILNRLNLYEGTYYFECSARVAAAGARVSVALFDLDASTFIAGSQIVFPDDDTVGIRQRSTAITIPASNTLIGVKLNTNNAAIGGAAWGCRIVRA